MPQVLRRVAGGQQLPLRAGAQQPLRWWPLVLVVLVVAPLVLLLRATVVTPVLIRSSSMLPTLAKGDVVLVDQGISGADLERGDLVTFASPSNGSSTLKRVVALPGDTLVVRDSVLYIDDQPFVEPYVDHEAIDAYYSPTFQVPVDTVFVMGDNRGNSEDSRDFGPVDVSAVKGRVLVRLWPPVRLGGPQPSDPKP